MGTVVKSAKKAFEDKKIEFDGLKNEIEKLKQAQDSLPTQNSNLATSIQKSQQKIDDLKKKQSLYESKRKEIEKEIKELEDRKTALEHRKVQGISAAYQNTTDVNHLEKKIKSKIQEKMDLNPDLQIKDLEKKIEKWEKEKADNQAKLHAIPRQLESKNQEVRDLEREVRSAEGNLRYIEAHHSMTLHEGIEAQMTHIKNYFYQEKRRIEGLCESQSSSAIKIYETLKNHCIEKFKRDIDSLSTEDDTAFS